MGRQRRDDSRFGWPLLGFVIPKFCQTVQDFAYTFLKLRDNYYFGIILVMPNSA